MAEKNEQNGTGATSTSDITNEEPVEKKAKLEGLGIIRSTISRI